MAHAHPAACAHRAGGPRRRRGRCAAVRHAAPVARAGAVFPRSARPRRLRHPGSGHRRATLRRAADSGRDRRDSRPLPAAGGRVGAAASLARRGPCRRRASGGDTATGRDPRSESSRPVRPTRCEFIGVDPAVRPMWTLVEGTDLPRAAAAAPAIVINRNLARVGHLAPGGRLALRCGGEGSALPPVDVRGLRHRRLPVRRCGRTDSGGDASTTSRGCAARRTTTSRRCCWCDRGRALAREQRRPPSTPRFLASARRHERGARRAFQPRRVLVLPADLGRARDGHAVLRLSADRRAADRVGEPAARGDRRAAGARAVPLAGVAGVLIESVILVFAGGAPRGAARRGCCRCGSTTSCGRCPACPPICTSSCSSRARSFCTSRCLRSPRWLPPPTRCASSRTLPIAATLRREVVS